MALTDYPRADVQRILIEQMMEHCALFTDEQQVIIEQLAKTIGAQRLNGGWWGVQVIRHPLIENTVAPHWLDPLPFHRSFK